MNKPPIHLIIFSALMLSAMLAAWIGVAGSLLNDIAARGVYRVANEWQTSISAAIALIAASLAVWNTTRTLRKSEELEAERRARKFAAVRASLPLSLSQIADYGSESIRFWKDLRKQCGTDGSILHSAVLVPEIPKMAGDVVKSFAEFIEFAPKRFSTDLIQNLLMRTQIHQSRLSYMISDLKKADEYSYYHEIDTNMLHAAYVHAGAGAAFDFSRRRIDTLKPDIDWDDVATSLRLNNVYESNFPTVVRLLNLYANSSPHPL
jgi:hypothetical protein